VEALKPVLFIDTEGGSLTVAREDILMVQDALSISVVLDILRDVRSGAIDAKTIVIDTLTSLYQEQMLKQMTELSVQRWADGVAGLQDYQVGHTRMRALLSALKKVPCNIICTAHAREFVDAAKLVYKRPSLPGQLSEDVSGYFDIVGYLYTKAVGKEVGYFAQFQNFGRIFAKERSPWGEPRLGAALDVTGVNLAEVVFKASILGISATDSIKAASLAKDDEIAGDAPLERQS
jgi:hypothetical protein